MNRSSTHGRARLAPTSLVMAGILMAFSVAQPVATAHQAIDTDQSTMTVRVFKTGLFRALADNHEVQASIRSGFVDDGANAGVEIVVDAPRLHVVDPGLSSHDRDQVQTRMLGPDVLDVTRFPLIRFESTMVEGTQLDGWTVRGRLTLHGQTQPVTVKVVFDHGHYRGSASLKQTDFGIAPISIAGGTVKVKDEVSIEFDVVTRSTNPAQPRAWRAERR